MRYRFQYQVADIANDRFIFHVAEMLFGNEIAATGSRNNNIAFFFTASIIFFTSKPSIAACKSANRIDFRNDNTATCTFQ